MFTFHFLIDWRVSKSKTKLFQILEIYFVFCFQGTEPKTFPKWSSTCPMEWKCLSSRQRTPRNIQILVNGVRRNIQIYGLFGPRGTNTSFAHRNFKSSLQLATRLGECFSIVFLCDFKILSIGGGAYWYVYISFFDQLKSKQVQKETVSNTRDLFCVLLSGHGTKD